MAESKGRFLRSFSMSRRKKDTKKPTELGEDDIDDVSIKLIQKKRTDSSKQKHGCDICLAESVFTKSLYLCYECGCYLCEKCSKVHDKNNDKNKSHKLVKRKKDSETKRIGKAESLVLGMRKEYMAERGESLVNLYGESVEVNGRVSMKYKDDKEECWITGLSRLENKRWVALDSRNYCMKIFCSVSNTLLRYIRFGSTPWDVTEIKVRLNPTDLDLASGSKTDISGAARDCPDKHRLLAVTFPWKKDNKNIWFIDVNKIPAIKTKAIKMDEQCYQIKFSEDKIFTLCKQDVKLDRTRHSIYILSTEGNQLQVVPIPGLSSLYIDDLAFTVFKQRIYLSDAHKNKVLCIYVEDGKTISQLTLEGSEPRGICVDPNSGVLYVCGSRKDKVYKLTPDLNKYEPFSLDTDYAEWPAMSCFINNKLIISHHWKSSNLKDNVTVVQL